MRKTTFLLLLICLVTLSCKHKTNQAIDPIINAEANDKELEKAKTEALKRFDYFIESLKKHAADTAYMYSLKIDFVENDQHEHMWVNITKMENDTFVGILGNEPQIIKNYKFGDKVIIKKEQVEDWILYNSITKKMEGGYSIEVFQNRE
ncbi:MAG: DUF2314 domain-containing protein [Paludibacter sp.]|nr:DUF2314 domain-containing protein [Paludibacter sp.]